MPRLRLREGWTTFLLLAGTIFSVVWAIQGANWADNLDILTPIALLGLALGLGLAKIRRLPALAAHAIAFLVGGWLIVRALDPLLPLAANAHGWLPAYHFLTNRWQTWIAATGTSRYADDYYLFLLGLAAIVWLMAYSGAWMIFRAHWIWPALLLPAVVLLLNLGYAPTSLSSYLVIFLAFAMVLVARFHVAVRETAWSRGGVAYPESLAWRALWVGLLVTVLIVGFAWVAPFTARGAPLQAVWDRVNSPWQHVEARFNEIFGSLRGPGQRGVGNFASFGDRFRLGGPLKLDQTPLLVLQADRPFYLKVRTFDFFDGHQWSSDVAATFTANNDGRSYVPQIDLKGGQALAVQPPKSSSQHDLTIRLLEPRGNALFFADQFVETSQDSLVQLSWTQYHDKRFDLTKMKRDDLPPDLRHLYDLLQNTTLPDTDAQGHPLPPPTPTPVPTRPAPAVASPGATPAAFAPDTWVEVIGSGPQDGLALRVGPAPGEELLRMLSPGAKVQIVAGPVTGGNGDPWYRVREGQDYGWVDGMFVRATTAPPLPTRPAPTPTQTPQQREIAAELSALSARLIDVRPVVQNGHAVGLIVNGQIANYGDVEAVLPRDGMKQGEQYKTEILTSDALAPQLRDAGTAYPDWVTQRYLELPASTTQRTRDLARQLANGQDPYDTAISIQNWLRANIKYNENVPVPPADRDVVDYLLFSSKQGYCEYYSTAMVVMLRSLGVPAREVTGLFSGAYDNNYAGYLYRESNAHAWVEAYFPGYGWVPFEPTAPRTPFNRDPAPAGQAAAGNANGGATAGNPDNGLGGAGDLPDDPRLLPGGAASLPQQPNRLLEVLRVAVPLVALLAVVLALLWLRGLRGLTPSGQFYARVTRAGGLAGVRRPPGTTPYEYARAVGEAVPGTRRSLDRIAETYVRERYGGRSPSPQEVRLVRRAWLTVRGALLR
ncbi:MAG TPA: transglutaminase domain-containing protein, partial [Thermomicrobiales bacterium]|nr:transglutaminase domain-containing protein [Thermomicrobiales bacterium]